MPNLTLLILIVFANLNSLGLNYNSTHLVFLKTVDELFISKWFALQFNFSLKLGKGKF